MRIETLDGLLEYCQRHQMPLDKMRFFIGENTVEPKAFGIYQSELTGEWIVYKNKANGERIVRYQGDNEAEAVSIILDKLKEEAGIRKNNKLVKKRQARTIVAFVAIFLIIIIGVTLYRCTRPVTKQGYYVRNDEVYYYQNGDLYYYDDDYDNWYPYYDSVDDDFYEDYYYGSDYTSDDVAEDFSDSEYYYDDYDDYDDDYSSNDNYYDDDDDSSFWDDDDDYDYDDWDSSDTDWDSDW